MEIGPGRVRARVSLFRRRPRVPRLEERLTARREPTVSAEPAAAKVESMLGELGLTPHPRDDVASGWTLETDAGRVMAVLDRQDGELRLLHFAAYADEVSATRERYAELLAINAGLDGAHYCLLELDGRRYLALRSLVGPDGIELPAVALALESLLSQARMTVPEGEPQPDAAFPLGEDVAARGGVLLPGGAEAALAEGAPAVESALSALELDWRIDPDQVHDWRIATDLGDLQIFLRPGGTSAVARVLLEEMKSDDTAQFYEHFVEMSSEESAYCALTEAGPGERWMWVQAVVSARTIRPAVLAYAIAAVLKQARSWIEA